MRSRYSALALLALLAGCDADPAAAPADHGTELRRMWNVAAADVTVTGPNGKPVDFLWVDAKRFPNPTFKGGTKDAYRAFTGIMLRFANENFAYLREHGLFTAPLQYDGENGVRTKTSVRDWTGVAREMITAEQGAALDALRQRIDGQ